MQQLKDRLNRRELTIGSWITIGHPSIAEIMATAGFDWLAIDMEHSAITLDQALVLIQVIELSGIPPLVRVGENDPTVIKRVMDAGAHGVIVPMVNSAGRGAEGGQTRSNTRLSGRRGVGLARAQRYGTGFESYHGGGTRKRVSSSSRSSTSWVWRTAMPFLRWTAWMDSSWGPTISRAL